MTRTSATVAERDAEEASLRAFASAHSKVGQRARTSDHDENALMPKMVPVASAATLAPPSTIASGGTDAVRDGAIGAEAGVAARCAGVGAGAGAVWGTTTTLASPAAR